MKRFFLIFINILIVCTACWQCKTTNATGGLMLSKSNQVFLTDSAKAAELIIIDPTDNIFEQMTDVDMCIQMKKNYPAETFHNQIVSDYASFLQQDVASFTADEASYVKSTMKDVFYYCEKISKGIFPAKLNIIKTKGKHYGNGVYYTRENCIIVPADVLKGKSKEEFFSTMIHEVFHVYSRLNPEKRAQLYELVGFHKLEKNLIVGEPLKNRILLNPDGIDFRYYINLQIAPDKEIKAIPIIYSNEATYKKNKASFFNYLKFELFEIKMLDSRKAEVVTKKDGSSTLTLKELPDFWRQIRENTQYIIHPDEILADNFMFLVKEQKDKSTTEQFTPEGKNLIEEIRNIIIQK
jgi:hypothetical protein